MCVLIRLHAFTARRYASAVLSMTVRLSVVSQVGVLSKRLNESSKFLNRGFL